MLWRAFARLRVAHMNFSAVDVRLAVTVPSFSRDIPRAALIMYSKHVFAAAERPSFAEWLSAAKEEETA